MNDYDFLRRSQDKAAGQALPQLSAVQTLEATAPQPTLRIRVEHSRTQRDGWGYSTTVEMDGIDVMSWPLLNDALNRIEAVLPNVRELGEQERDIRNQRDTAAKEATTQSSP